MLISTVRKRFEGAGGLVYEKAPLASVSIRPGAAVLEMATGEVIRARLLLDCMGQRSIMVQTCSSGTRPWARIVDLAFPFLRKEAEK